MALNQLVLGMALGTVLGTALERPDAGYLVGSLDEGALRTVLSSAPLDGRGSMACGLEGAAGAAAHSERCKRTVLYACNLFIVVRWSRLVLTGLERSPLTVIRVFHSFFGAVTLTF